MENPNGSLSSGEATDPGLHIVKYSPFQHCTKLSSAWFDLRVFYVRVSNFRVDDSTPELLTLNHIPLSPDTRLEVNGARSNFYFDGVSSLLRRDRVDKKSEEATYVSTDSIRLSGSVKFELFDKEDLILSGVLEMPNSSGVTGESKNSVKHWSMNCESEITAGTGFLKGKHISVSELPLPAIEVYVAGSFLGTPIILTKTLQLSFRKKHNRKGMLDAIPEYETTENGKNVSSGLHWQVAEYRNHRPEYDEVYSSMYWRRTQYIDDEDGERSWFNAGVRVGLGIGLGVCVGVGIGVGLLVHTYQFTTRNLRRGLL